MDTAIRYESLEFIGVSALIPYARNARTHSETQVAQIAASIREFGFTNPVLIADDNTIIAGHGRVMAAQVLAMETVPCLRLSHMTEAQRRAYVIADNKLALNAGWDDELLALELGDLRDAGFDVTLTGFSDDELAGLLIDDDMATEGQTDEDAVPDAPPVPVSALGDLWALGDHRLICGDSTQAEAIDTLMGGQPADMVFTDPPYGMSYGGGRAAGSSRAGARVKSHGMIMNDDLQGDDLTGMVRDAIANAMARTRKGGALYACLTWRTYAEFRDALLATGNKIKACIVWDKGSIGLGNAHYRPQHEFIFYTGGDWHGDKSQSDVWQMSRGSTADYVHPTQKPVGLVERAIENSSKPGATVLDCFGGSGSTLIACEKTGRRGRLIELDPRYCDVIVQRWQDYTGRKATHAVNGRPFDDLRAEAMPANINAAPQGKAVA